MCACVCVCVCVGLCTDPIYTLHTAPQPSKLSDNLVQQFLLPDETPSILEAEMALRAEQLVNGEHSRHLLLGEKKQAPQKIVSPKVERKHEGVQRSREVAPPPQQETADKKDAIIQEVKMPEVQEEEKKDVAKTLEAREEKAKQVARTPEVPVEKWKQVDEEKREEEKSMKEARQEPEGQLADCRVTEQKKEVGPTESSSYITALFS